MSNKNNLQKIKAEKERLKKKKILLQMQKEVIDLEHQIKYAKLTNFKNGTIKNLRISARFGQRIAPYVLVAGIMAGGCKLIGAGLPFIPDELHIISHIMNEFDNQGNIRYEQQYESFGDEDNTLSFYSKWILQEDGFYMRNIKTFDVEKMKKDDILKLFNNPEEIKSLEEVLGKPVDEKKEYKNKLDIPEEENIDFLQAITYDVDKEDYIIVKESMGDNIGITIIYLLLTALAESIPLFIRSEVSSFDFGDCVYDIKRRYKKVDVENLTKKLEIKRDNYNRLLK